MIRPSSRTIGVCTIVQHVAKVQRRRQQVVELACLPREAVDAVLIAIAKCCPEAIAAGGCLCNCLTATVATTKSSLHVQGGFLRIPGCAATHTLRDMSALRRFMRW